jgi:hypothetical protein
MKLFATPLALLIAIVSADPAFATTKKATAHPKALHPPGPVAGPSEAFLRRPHSPNPAWDVYRINGQYMGSDPDPRVRLMLRKDNLNEY